jgi:hypothetical protein
MMIYEIDSIIKGLRTWLANNATQMISKSCRIIDKRAKVWGGSGDSSASTNYFVTFEFEDNTRKELHVKDNHFGLMVIGDHGDLTYQGTRFKDFKRSMV